MLKKVYKYVQPAGAKDEKPDENGVTDAMFEFSWERDVEAQVRVVFLCGTGGALLSEPKIGACRHARLIGRTTPTTSQSCIRV